MTTIEVDDEDLAMIEDVLKRCEEALSHRDIMLARVGADVRNSMLTLATDHALNRVKEIRGVA